MTLEDLKRLAEAATPNPEVKKAIDRSMSAVEQMIAAQRSGDDEMIRSAARAVRSAARAAESARAEYDYFADKLLEILRGLGL